MSFSETYNIVWTGSIDPSMLESARKVEMSLEGVRTRTIELGEETEAATSMGVQGWRNMIFTTQMGIFYVSMLANAYMRMESAQLSAQDAQEAYNEAVAKFGPHSEEAETALRRLERAQLAVNRAQLTSQLNMVGLTLQMGSFALMLASKVVPWILAHTTATIAQTAAVTSEAASTWGLVSALLAEAVAFAMAHPWLAAAMIAAGAAVAVAGAIYISSVINIGGNGTTEEDLDEALEEHDRKARYEYRRATGG